MPNVLDKLVEARIEAARARGEFDNLPGAGQPVPAEPDALVPAELRVGYRLLKNAGYLPAELQWRKELQNVEQLLRSAIDAAERAGLQARARRLLVKLELHGRGELWRREMAYRQRLLQRAGNAATSGRL